MCRIWPTKIRRASAARCIVEHRLFGPEGSALWSGPETGGRRAERRKEGRDALVGAGALAATDEVIAVAEKLGAGVAKALLGKAALPDELAWVTGSIGLLGTEAELRTHDGMRHPSHDRLRLPVFGIPAEGRPGEGCADRVKADMLSIRYPDGGQPRGRSQRDAPGTISSARAKKRAVLARQSGEERFGFMESVSEERAMAAANPVNPQRVIWELSPRIPDRAGCLTSNSGSCANWYARDLKIRRGMMASLSGGLASMGAAVPYAVAAGFTIPIGQRSRWSEMVRCR